MEESKIKKNVSLVDVDFYQDSIGFTQKYVTYLNQSIIKFNYKTSKVRDAGDEIAKSIIDYVEKDTSNDELFQQNIKQFANYFLMVEDHRDYMVSVEIK